MLARSVTFRTSPELHNFLKFGMKNFNERVALPTFKKPVDMVEYSRLVANYLERSDLDRSFLIQPRKKTKKTMALEFNKRFPL